MRILTHLVAATLFAAVPPALSAQDLTADLLPPDTSFVATFDIAKIVDLIGGDELLAHMNEHDAQQANEMLSRVREELGFDLLHDVCSVTVFGGELPPQEPGIVIVTTDAIDDAIEALTESGGVHAEKRDGIEFLTLDATGVARALGFGDVEVDGGQHVVAFVHPLASGRRAVVVGESESGISDAARALAGKGKGKGKSSGKGERAALELDPSPGTIVYFEIAGALDELVEETPASKLAGQIEGMVAELSEQDGDLTMRLQAHVESERVAKDVAAVVDGLRGLLSLADVGDEVPASVRRAFMSAETEVDDESVSVRISLPMVEVRKMVDDGIEVHRHASKRAAKRAAAADDDDEDGEEAEEAPAPRRKRTHH